MAQLSKTEAKEYISSFFSKPSFTSEEVRKIRNLAMQHRIPLGRYRKLFCKGCLARLNGSTRLTSLSKTVICANCGKRNRFKLTDD